MLVYMCGLDGMVFVPRPRDRRRDGGMEGRNGRRDGKKDGRKDVETLTGRVRLIE